MKKILAIGIVALFVFGVGLVAAAPLNSIYKVLGPKSVGLNNWQIETVVLEMVVPEELEPLLSGPKSVDLDNLQIETVAP